MMCLKRAFIMIFTLILMLGATGCMGTKNISFDRKENVKEKMISYMEAKYNDEFVYIDSVDGGLNQNERYFLVSNSKLPREEIKVVYHNNNGIEMFADNYIHLKYKEQTTELIEKLLREVFERELIVDYQIKTPSSPNNFTSTTSFEEFIENNMSDVVFYAVINNFSTMDIEEIAQKTKSVFEKEFPYCKGYVYFAENENDFKSIYELPNWKIESMQQFKFSTEE